MEPSAPPPVAGICVVVVNWALDVTMPARVRPKTQASVLRVVTFCIDFSPSSIFSISADPTPNSTVEMNASINYIALPHTLPHMIAAHPTIKDCDPATKKVAES
jgi:hypothetical protein